MIQFTVALAMIVENVNLQKLNYKGKYINSENPGPYLR
jgi:hypothetical protein